MLVTRHPGGIPIGIWAGINASEIPAMLQELRNMCAVVLDKPVAPRRDDGFEKMLVAFEAILLWGIKTEQEWHELAAILYGTDDVADVRRACRSLREQLPALKHRAMDQGDQLRSEKLGKAMDRLAQLRGDGRRG
jgi:hypothetical protein